MRLNVAGNNFIFGHINRENAPKTFSVNLVGRELPKCVRTHSKQLRFWTQKSRKYAHNFCIKFARRKLPKSVWTSWQTASFVDTKIVIMRTELVLYTSQGENFQNWSKLRRKQLHFWTHKLWKCAQNFLHKPHQAKTSKMRLNLTENSFIFGRINRDIAPRTFLLQTCKRRISKLRLNFFSPLTAVYPCSGLRTA